MRWILATTVFILIISFALLRPERVHPGWEVAKKGKVVSEIVKVVKEKGWRILVGDYGDAEVVKRCGGERGIYYCLTIPEANKAVKLRYGFDWPGD